MFTAVSKLVTRMYNKPTPGEKTALVFIPILNLTSIASLIYLIALSASQVGNFGAFVWFSGFAIPIGVSLALGFAIIETFLKENKSVKTGYALSALIGVTVSLLGVQLLKFGFNPIFLTSEVQYFIFSFLVVFPKMIEKTIICHLELDENQRY